MYIHSQILLFLYPKLHGYFLMDSEMVVIMQNLADTRLLHSALGSLRLTIWLLYIHSPC